jgi:hypothetical protein
MDLALYAVNAVLVEGRSVRDVAAATRGTAHRSSRSCPTVPCPTPAPATPAWAAHPRRSHPPRPTAATTDTQARTRTRSPTSASQTAQPTTTAAQPADPWPAPSPHQAHARRRRSRPPCATPCADQHLQSPAYVPPWSRLMGPRRALLLTVGRARSSFEPHRGEIPTGRSSFESQTREPRAGRHFASDPARTSRRYGPTATPTQSLK